MAKNPNPILEQEKTAKIDEITTFIEANGLKWPELRERFGFADSDYSSFSKLSQLTPSLRKVREFHSRIFRRSTMEAVQIAGEHVGQYLRDDYAAFEGKYALIRPSIHEPRVIYGYAAQLGWDGSSRSHFLQLDSPGSVLQRGTVYFVRDLQSVCVHFNEKFNNCMLLLKANVGDRNLYGSMLSLLPTLSQHHFSPACVPVVLVWQKDKIPLGNGYIASGHELYEKCLQLITSVTKRDVVLTGWWDK